MLATLTWLSVMAGFGQLHAQYHSDPMLQQQPLSPPPVYAAPQASSPEMRYAPPMASPQYARAPQPMAPQVREVQQMPQPPLAAPQEQIPRSLELPPFEIPAAAPPSTGWSQPPAVEAQLGRPQTDSERHAVHALPEVVLRPKPAAKLEFTKDPALLREQRAAYEEKEAEYLRHLHSEFEGARELVLGSQEDDVKAVGERVDLQVSNQEELLELEFERQDAILAQHFETRNTQLGSRYEKERPLLELQGKEALKNLLAEMERSHTEQLELIEAAAKAESKKFDEAKALIQDYHHEQRSSESGITSDLNMHENNYESILKNKMSELQLATSDDFVN